TAKDSSSVDSSSATELYAKPDDRCEVSNVADRCPMIVEQMSDSLREWEELAGRGELNALAALDEALLQGLA
ncbi:MAG: hypothetical protein N2C14_08045, partial [Planctomycetales bacterium]